MNLKDSLTLAMCNLGYTLQSPGELGQLPMPGPIESDSQEVDPR